MTKIGAMVLSGSLAVFLGVMLYAMHLRTAAAGLVKAIADVRSTADAETVIETWRRRSNGKFWSESDHPGGNHTFDGQIENVFLSRLGLFGPTALTVGLTMNQGKLKVITVGMMGGNRANPASAWVAEWFDSKDPNLKDIHKLNHNGIGIDFSATLQDEERKRLFALNTDCFTKFRGCKSIEEILPLALN